MALFFAGGPLLQSPRFENRRSGMHTSGPGCLLAVSFSARVTVPDHVLLQRVGDESVVLNLKTELYFGLDSTGTSMWEALTKAETVDEAYLELLDTYDVEPRQLREDLEALIENLLRNGLLETSGE